MVRLPARPGLRPSPGRGAHVARRCLTLKGRGQRPGADHAGSSASMHRAATMGLRAACCVRRVVSSALWHFTSCRQAHTAALRGGPLSRLTTLAQGQGGGGGWLGPPCVDAEAGTTSPCSSCHGNATGSGPCRCIARAPSPYVCCLRATRNAHPPPPHPTARPPGAHRSREDISTPGPIALLQSKGVQVCFAMGSQPTPPVW